MAIAWAEGSTKECRMRKISPSQRRVGQDRGLNAKNRKLNDTRGIYFRQRMNELSKANTALRFIVMARNANVRNIYTLSNGQRWVTFFVWGRMCVTSAHRRITKYQLVWGFFFLTNCDVRNNCSFFHSLDIVVGLLLFSVIERVCGQLRKFYINICRVVLIIICSL